MRSTLWLLLLLLLLLGCTASKPEPIQYGVEACDDCKMTIADRRFGGETLTSKGKVFKFDSLECLKAYSEKHAEIGAKFFVVDATQNGSLIPAEGATFVIDPVLRSPMGRGIIAGEKLDSLSSFFSGGAIPSKRYTWTELLKELERPSASGAH